MSLFSKIRHFTTKLIMNWLNPEPEKQQTGTQVTKASSDDHIKVIYGTQKTAGTIVFMNVTNPDDDDDVKNDLLHIIIVWCEGGVESVEDILLNDISITDSKFSAKGGGRWAYAYNFTNGMAGLSSPHLRDAGWDGAAKNHRLDGLCCTYLRLEWSIGDNAPFTGVPDVEAIIKGRKVKNLETGRVEYSENPAYCAYDYFTNPIFSKGLKSHEYNYESFKTAGLIADTRVPLYQGSDETKPLFTCNLTIDTSAPVIDNAELIGKSMRALMPIINGQLTLIIEQDEEPTPYGLSELDFIGSVKYDAGSKDKRYNRVIVEYIDKELNHSEQDAIYPEPDSELADQWLNEDNGVLLEYRFKVSSCNNYYEARQMARIIAMISRESLNFTVNVAPIGLRYTVGDVIPISHKKLGWVNKPFRLIEKTDLEQGTFNFTLREHQPYIYNWLSGVVRPPIPDTSLPNPRNVAAPANFSSTLLDDGNVQIGWESDYSHFDIQIYKNNALILSTTSVTPAFVITALDAGSYEMDVRAASKIGFRSEWVSFGFSVALPAEPIVSIDAVTYNTITLSANVTGASLGTTFDWQFLGPTSEPIANPNTASGYNYIYTGLVPDTEYSFKVRTKNLSGVSPWVDVAVKTSLSDLLDYIDDIPLKKLSEDAQTLIEDINTQVDRLRPETENNLPSLIAKNIDALTGLNSKVEVIDSENPNNLQAQLAQSNSQITNLERITEVLDPQNETGLPSLIKLNNLAIEKERLAIRNIELSVLNTAASYTNWRQEYERRVATGERLIDAAVYIDKDTGTIVNRAHAYTDEAFRSASLMVDGLNSKITLNAQELASSQTRISKAEAQLVVQAAQINQKATFEQVDSQIAGALAALQPAYNWQFNSGDEGFNPQSHHATGYIVATSKITSPAINYDADENPMFRLRVRKHAGAQWVGKIYFNGGNSAINLPEPTTNEWENLNVDATGTQDYTGTINSLEFDLGACDIDFIQVGKRGANDLALADITARTTELEQDINAATGIMAQYATTNWVTALGYQTQSNVQTLIDTFNSTYSIAATLQELNDQQVIIKANAAQTWIDGAEATIRDQVSSILNSDEGVNQRLSHAEQSLDAVAGQITSSVTQVQGLARDVSDQGIAGVLAAYNDLLLEQDLAVQGVKIATAQERLTAISNDVENVASQTLELMALQGQNAAYLTSLNQAFANEKTARTIAERELKAEITTQSTQAVAQANERLKAVVGYCIDENGNTVDEPDAIACIAAGHEWVDGPLVQLINDYTTVFVNNQGYQTAANVQQFISTFDGEYGITATLQELDSNGTIEAAKSAQQWISAADGTITDLITQFVNTPDGINDSIAHAEQLIQANADDIENEATARQQLSVRMGEAESDLVSLDEAIVNEQQARASQGSQLRVEFQAQDIAMLALANEYTRATTGYCVDANGEIVDQNDAAQCELDGHTWVNLPSVQKAVELSAAYVNEQGYQTQSNVSQLIDTFNSTYSITATLQEFNQNDTLEKANNAQQFINAAEGYIKEQITVFNAAEGSVNAKFANVEQTLDAINGTISNNIVQVQGLELDLENKNLNDVINSVNQLLKNNELTKEGAKLAVAQTELKAKTDEIESVASQALELAAIFEQASGQITVLNQIVANEKQAAVLRDERYLATFDTVTARFSDVTTAIATIDEANTVRDQEFESFVADTISSFDEVAETFASQNQAFTTLSQTLTSKIENDTDQAKNEAIATAQEYTRTAVGYCVDAEGNITSENDAVVCVDQGGSWVQGPLAEYISNLQISDGESTASIKELKQVFKKVNGELVARGGWVLDNNGRAVSVAGYNDGETGNLDLVADVIRQGVMVGNTFVPTSYIDNTDPANPVHIFKGKMILGDNYAVESEADIRAKDGADGADGVTPTITTNPDGSYTISNGSETVTIRDGENAPIPTVTDNGNGTHTITDGSGNSIVVKDGEDGYTPVKGTDYFDGNDGSYNSFIFTTGTTTPQTPTGGSFDGTNEIIPNGYKDSPYFEEGKITYVSKTMYINVGTAWVKSGWSKPAEYIIKGDTGESAYTNLIRPHGHWVTGRSGSQGIFSKKGTTEHNKVISGLGPQGTYEAIWISELANPEGAAGGWDVTVTDTDPTLSYRYSVWMREEQGEDHTLYLGCAPCKNLDNTDNNNPYFFTGNLPIKQKWYLVVGILHSSNKSNELTSGISGIYDPETGEKVITSPEFKQKEGATTQIHRAFRFYAKNDSNAMFCRPRLEVIDGEEMSLGLLMGRIPKDGEDGKDGQNGQDGKDGQNGQNGQDGTRGSVQIEVATSTGVWYDSTANNSLPSAPVIHDRVTIYKASDPAVQTTKRYTGSSWQSYVLHVHGSALIDDTVDAKVLRAGTRISSPRIDLIGDSFMKIEYAPGFGPDNVWYWYGPKILSNGLPNLAALTKANALEWKDTGGNGYFGGSIVAGTYSTALTTTDLSADAFVEIGPFGSNGGVINIVCSLQLNSMASGTSTNPAGKPSDPVYTIQLSELVNGSWVVRQTQTYHGAGKIVTNDYDRESDSYHWLLTQSASGSFTYTDNKRTTTDRTYKLAITSRSGVNIYGSWQNPSQKLSIISQED